MRHFVWFTISAMAFVTIGQVEPAFAAGKKKPAARAARAARPVVAPVRQPESVAGGWAPCAGCSRRPIAVVALTSDMPAAVLATSGLSSADAARAQTVLANNTRAAWTGTNLYTVYAPAIPKPFVNDGYEFRYVVEQAAGRSRTVADDSRYKEALRQIEQSESRSRDAYEEAARLREAAERQRQVAAQAQSFNQQNMASLGANTSLLGLVSRAISGGSAMREAAEADQYDAQARDAEQQARRYADAALTQRRAATAAQADMPMVARHSIGLRYSCALHDNVNGVVMGGLQGQNAVAEAATPAAAMQQNAETMLRTCKSHLPTDGGKLEVRTRVTGIGDKGVTLNQGRRTGAVPGDVFDIVRRQPGAALPVVVAKARVVRVLDNIAEAEIADRRFAIRAGDAAIWKFRSEPPSSRTVDFGAVAASPVYAPYVTDQLGQRSAAYDRVGDTIRARADFDAARLGAKSADQLNYLCWQVATGGTTLLDQALAACDASLALKPDDANTIDSRGLVLLRLGRLDDAITAYTRALSLSPRLAGSRYGRALVFARRGDGATASTEAAAALKEDPDLAAVFGGYGLAMPPAG